MIADFIFGFIASVLSAMGVGGGGVLVIYLTLIKKIPQLQSQGINLLYFIPSAIISLSLNRKNLSAKGKTVFTLCAVGVLSSVVFSVIASKIGNGILKRLFGIFLVASGVFGLFDKKHKAKTQSKDHNGKKLSEADK